MAGRGVHFALTSDECSALVAHGDDEARLEFVQEEIEARLFDDEPERVCETDKAWMPSTGRSRTGRWIPAAKTTLRPASS